MLVHRVGTRLGKEELGKRGIMVIPQCGYKAREELGKWDVMITPWSLHNVELDNEFQQWIISDWLNS